MHFNITKPQSNDYFSLGVMNDNYDEIDDVMYANQQSAAKVMVGATSLADGESGRVPAPTSADRTKYLKGDGTWDTPSGGGGGSSVTITPTLSSGTKIADYSIDGVNNSLYAPSGGGGGSSINYSTTEQIVGSYMGETLYEIVIDNLSVPSNTSWTNITTIQGGKDLIDFKAWGYFSEYFLVNYNQAHIDTSTGTLEARFVEGGRTITRIAVQYTKAGGNS